MTTEQDRKKFMSIHIDYTASQSLSLEGIRNELVRHIQSMRKSVGCDITETIKVNIKTTDEYILSAINIHSDYIKDECLIDNLSCAIDEKNTIELNGNSEDFNPDKFHTPVGLIKGIVGYDISYKHNIKYKHYWEALEEWEKIK